MWCGDGSQVKREEGMLHSFKKFDEERKERGELTGDTLREFSCTRRNT